jgi:steroid 5-alpha reductase family enzyme
MTFTIAALHLAVALTVSSLGFKRLVYFVSLGYAFSITAQAVLSVVGFWETLSWSVAGQLALLGLYGARLGTYLAWRERSPAYQRELSDVQQRATGIGRGKQVLIWLAVSLLYVLMFSPALATLTGQPDPKLVWLGVGLMAAGIAVEALADAQKNRFKQRQPSHFCNVGLYRYSRCPNYFGEIVFWLGNFVAGVSAYRGAGWWAAATTGLGCIVLIMMGSTKRLERKQDERYGERADYQRYRSSVPVLFPLVPIYSLQHVKVYLE